MRRGVVFILLLALAGCGGAAMHGHDTMDLPGGRRLESDYWVLGAQCLADPIVTRIDRRPDGSWSVDGVKVTTDNQGLGAVVEGLVRGFLGLLGKP